jgi:hypothetical protein
MRVVVTKKPFKGHVVGAEIDIAKRDARALIAVGRVALPVAAVVVAEEVVEPEPEAKLQKRSYRRRDMTAED